MITYGWSDLHKKAKYTEEIYWEKYLDLQTLFHPCCKNAPKSDQKSAKGQPTKLLNPLNVQPRPETSVILNLLHGMQP